MVSRIGFDGFWEKGGQIGQGASPGSARRRTAVGPQRPAAADPASGSALLLIAGYRSTKVSRICASANVSVGALYHYFDGKEDIAGSIFSEVVDHYQRGFRQQLADNPDARDGIRAGVWFHLAWARDNPRLASFILQRRETLLSAGLIAANPSFDHTNRVFFDDLHDWIAGHVAQGQIRPLPRHLYYPAWMGGAHEFVRLWLPRRNPDALRDARLYLPWAAWSAMRQPAGKQRIGFAHVAQLGG